MWMHWTWNTCNELIFFRIIYFGITVYFPSEYYAFVRLFASSWCKTTNKFSTFCHLKYTSKCINIICYWLQLGTVSNIIILKRGGSIFTYFLSKIIFTKFSNCNTFIQYQQATYFTFHIGNNTDFNESIWFWEFVHHTQTKPFEVRNWFIGNWAKSWSSIIVYLIK